MNTMTIDNVTYELILHGQGCTDVPSVMCDGKAYIGKAIPNQPTWFFTTYDKVKIYGKTGTVWVVNSAWAKFEVSTNRAIGWLEEERDDFTFFAYEHNAAEFLLMNKPCLSVNDVKKFIDFVPYEENWIINLAKEKINATT